MTISKSSLVRTFENDSCDLAWEFYKAYYEGSILWDNYHVEKPIRVDHDYRGYSVSSDGEGPYAFVRKGNECCRFKEGSRVPDPERLGGNVDFNLLGKHGGYKKSDGQPLLKADRLIEIAGGDESIIDEVEEAKKRSREPWNHSLMLSTGNLQSAQSKGLVLGENAYGKREYEWLDRPDSLVYLISRFYGEDRWKGKYNENYCGSTNPENIDALAGYLKAFRNIYEYCNQIYGIDAELVDRMIELGSKPLKSKELVKKYLQLANDFWDERAESERGGKAICSLSGSEEVERE